ncbi:hypothetical protein RFI_03625, partial [Reticulomyxa filosa]
MMFESFLLVLTSSRPQPCQCGQIFKKTGETEAYLLKKGSAMSHSQPLPQTDTLSLAARYSLLRGRHLSLEKYCLARHGKDQAKIQELEDHVSILQSLLQQAQRQVHNLSEQLRQAKTSVNAGSSVVTNNDSINTNNSNINSNSNNNNLNETTNKKLMQLSNKKSEQLLDLTTLRNLNKQALFDKMMNDYLLLSDPYNIRLLNQRIKTPLPLQSQSKGSSSNATLSLNELRQNDVNLTGMLLHN